MTDNVIRPTLSDDLSPFAKMVLNGTDLSHRCRFYFKCYLVI